MLTISVTPVPYSPFFGPNILADDSSAISSSLCFSSCSCLFSFKVFDLIKFISRGSFKDEILLNILLKSVIRFGNISLKNPHILITTSILGLFSSERGMISYCGFHISPLSLGLTPMYLKI